MTDVRSINQEVQGQILTSVRRSQDFVTEAVKTWAEAVQAVTPALPTPRMPLVERLPKPGELVSDTYDFVEQLLAAQRKFANELLAVTAPAVAHVGGESAAKKAGPAGDGTAKSTGTATK